MRLEKKKGENMANVLIMPRQGNTVESCVIVDWKVKEGDSVTVDTLVVEIETDKATFEVPAGFDGTVLKILCESGDDIPVLQPIMVVGNPGEDWQSLVGDATPAAETPAEQSAPVAAEKQEATPIQVQTIERSADDIISISPRAKALAFDEAVDYRVIAGTGPEGRIIENDIMAAIANRAPLTAAAKDALREQIAKGLSTGVVQGEGSGIGGRITSSDSGMFASSSSPAATSASANVTQDEYEDTPIKGIRKVIAERMMSSLATTAQFTLNASTPAVRMQELRKRLKNCSEELGLSKVTVNDLVLFLVSRMLPLHPGLNAQKLDTTLRTFKHVHLGVAVDTPRGLMVPVIRFADTLSLEEISKQAKELATACIEGTISPDLLQGSTFTVTNLGNTGIESFTPVINAPEVAILGVCGISPKPVDNGQGGYDILPHLSFSLTSDHTVVDGSPAARFLKAFCDAFKDVDLWLGK